MNGERGGEDIFQMVLEGKGGNRFVILIQLHTDSRLFFKGKGPEATFTTLVSFP